MPKFEPGQSGNPGGRPLSLGRKIREKFGEDGAELVEALALVALGATADIEQQFGSSPTLRDRMLALGELLDRGWGKSTQVMEHSGPEGGAMRVTFGGRYKPDA